MTMITLRIEEIESKKLVLCTLFVYYIYIVFISLHICTQHKTTYKRRILLLYLQLFVKTSRSILIYFMRLKTYLI